MAQQDANAVARVPPVTVSPVFEWPTGASTLRGPMDIFKTFALECAHRLPNVPAGHKCARMHGHSFRVEVHVSGPVDANSGWVMDFADVRDAFEPLFKRLDHRCLNDVPGLENPTSEILAHWLWQRLTTLVPYLAAITIHETCASRCTYRGE